MNHLDKDWCGLQWSRWFPFMEKKSVSGNIDKGPGIYRVKDVDDLLYIGIAVKCLHKELKGLNKEIVKGKVANSKHPAAQCLWAYHNEVADSQEVSVLHHDGGEDEKSVLESYLIWKYRLAKGRSPHCNFGRLHPAYMRAEKKGPTGLERMGEADAIQENVSQPPLEYSSSFKENDWMGLHWSDWDGFDRKVLKALPEKQGFYRLADADMTQMLLLRRADDLKAALKKQSKERWARDALFSHTLSAEGLEETSMAEVENDLIAGYYEEMRLPPTYQFGYRKPEEVVKAVVDDTPEPSAPAEEDTEAVEQEAPEEPSRMEEVPLSEPAEDDGGPSDEEDEEEEDEPADEEDEEEPVEVRSYEDVLMEEQTPPSEPDRLENVPREDYFLGEEEGKEEDKGGKKRKKEKKRRK